MPKIIPYGERILVEKQKVGEKIGEAGIIIATEQTSEAETDICEILHIPEHSFADEALITSSERIIGQLTVKAGHGDSEALKALLEFNVYLKIKTLKVGDKVLLSRYSGTKWHDNEGKEGWMIRGEDIIGLVVNE